MNKLTNGKALRPPARADYETDVVLWSERQAQLLRSQKFDQLDLPNLLEELDAMGASQRKELRSRLVVLPMHLLKCRYQPERKSASWTPHSASSAPRSSCPWSKVLAWARILKSQQAPCITSRSSGQRRKQRFQ